MGLAADICDSFGSISMIVEKLPKDSLTLLVDAVGEEFCSKVPTDCRAKNIRRFMDVLRPIDEDVTVRLWNGCSKGSHDHARVIHKYTASLLVAILKPKADEANRKMKENRARAGLRGLGYD